MNLKVNAETSMTKFSKFVIKKGFTRCEVLVGILVSIGGSIAMSDDLYDFCILNYLTSVEYLNNKEELKSFKKES